MATTPDGAFQVQSVQPGSPTLTNPDMILPDSTDYYDVESPDRKQLETPVAIWQGTPDLSFQLPHQAYPPGPVTPTTPIIYGNGTMLSDIGEVTEAESVCVKPPKLQAPRKVVTEDDTAMTVAELLERKRQAMAARQRRASIDSNSTITGGNDQANHFADFDDSVSMADSNFQGDDEESVAESYSEGPAAHHEPQRDFLLGQTNMDERYSTALSRRAEQILANAKRRLTTMEGNLHRARSSISSPSFSSASSDRGTSPQRNRNILGDHAINSAKTRYGHARISSEHNVPTGPKANGFLPRSSSALGAAGGYRKPATLPLMESVFDVDTNDDESDYSTEGKEQPQTNGVYGNPTFSMSKPVLNSAGTTPIESGFRDSLYSEDFNPYLRPDSAFSQGEHSVRRSASASQMRDLKDQMNDLKGRLSSLRDQARADTMKRRSMQSLRTPSPFTHAPVEQWYAPQRPGTQSSEVLPKTTDGPPAERSPAETSDERGSAVTAPQPEQEQAKPLDQERQSGDVENADDSMLGFVEVVDEDDDIIPYQPSHLDGENDMEDDLRTEDGFSDYNEDFVDVRSESEASTYHDSVQHQLSHEDREDAFDYEHFFLHSAMGSMTRRRMERRGSDTTYTSEESVETTRGLEPEPENSWEKGHARHRRDSHGSASTVASFATATEGRHTRLDGDAVEGPSARYRDSVEVSRPPTSQQAKRLTFGALYGHPGPEQNSRPPSSMQKAGANIGHRPSMSSLGSIGTSRSFPLVNKPKSNGIMTPRDSPEQPSPVFAESETSSIYDLDSMAGDNTTAAMTALTKDDQILVQRLVASLGKCVLGLTESGRASTESRIARKRIERAKAILEGLSD